jgi:hypothetical protein
VSLELRWECGQERICLAGSVCQQVEDLSVRCGHENPFEGRESFSRMIRLKIDSLFKVLATFLETILGKCKKIYQ